MSIPKYQNSTIAGVAPAVSNAVCAVDDVRWKLYEAWREAEKGPEARYLLLSHLLRLVVTVAIGRGEEGHLHEIRILAGSLTGIPGVEDLIESLEHHEGIWRHHIEQGFCPTQICDISSIAPCRKGCPAGINIPNFLAQMAQDNDPEAIRIIVRDNPLPFICGLICPAPCEDACVRGATSGEPVFIRLMKAVAAAETLAAGAYPHRDHAPATGKRVAILGSGPSALAASGYLAVMGHQVTCFEKESAPGGMLRFGIPGFRLPEEVLRQEVDQLRNIGVEFRTDTTIENIDELKRGHDAVFIAVGTPVSRILPLPGVENDFVHGAIEFLRAVRQGREIQAGPRVVVIGAGSVAMDAVLTAKKIGIEDVELFCLERREEMPAHPRELEEVEEAGVPINNSWGPLRIEKDGRIVFQRCNSLFDEHHHFNPDLDPENTCEREVNQVVLAIGQTTKLSFVSEKDNIKVERNLLAVHPDSLETDSPGVFAGGDAQHGPRLVVDAVADGKRAAHAIDAYLYGRHFNPEWGRFLNEDSVKRATVSAEERSDEARVQPHERDVKLRYGNAPVVKLEMPTVAESRSEAHRCLRCDLCVGCGLCELACAEMGVRALKMEHALPGRLAFADFRHPQALCIGCGACAQVCPHDAIRLLDEGGKRRIEITGTVVAEHPLVQCTSCGAEYATEAFIAHIEERLPESLKNAPERHLCAECAREGFAGVLNAENRAADNRQTES